VAKEKEFDENEVKGETFKVVRFGGYDKGSVDFYIDNMKSEHEKEVNELKANVNKLSDAVLSLKTMREVNQTESTKTIDSLKESNAEYESEIESLKEQLNAYKQREYESAGRYESISRTLLEARENADALIAQTTKECEAKTAEVNAALTAHEEEVTSRCEKLEQDTIDRCNNLEADTKSKCQQMYDQTENSCNTMKEQAYSESERLRTKAREDADALNAKTAYECKTQKEDATREAEGIVNQATTEAYVLRKNVKKECEAVSKYMKELLSSLDNVVDACSKTKDVADRAFTGLSSEATAMVADNEAEAAGAQED
jgi:cell division septum initiation protein DivIVA